MNEHSSFPTDQRDTNTAADSAALLEINTSELEGVDGGLNPQPLPPAPDAHIHVDAFRMSLWG